MVLNVVIKDLLRKKNIYIHQSFVKTKEIITRRRIMVSKLAKNSTLFLIAGDHSMKKRGNYLTA